MDTNKRPETMARIQTKEQADEFINQQVEAVKKQVDSLSHVSNLYYSTPMLNLAEKLVPMAKAQKVFFANSGAEANEGAIKVARKYGNDKYNGERYEIITLVNSFHGRTISTLSATGQDHFH